MSEPGAPVLTKPANAGPKRHPWRLVRLIQGRPRLFVSIAFGLAVGFLTPSSWRDMTRWLIAWNTSTLLYFILTGWLIVHASPASIRYRAKTQDEGRFAILVLTSIAALTSIGAIVAQLASVKDLTGIMKGIHIGLAMATIVSAWLFIHLMFALHYAHDYFAAEENLDHVHDFGRNQSKIMNVIDSNNLERDAGEKPASTFSHPALDDGSDRLRGGLKFPETENPDYYDFLYFSYVIGVAAQTADVAITSKGMRKTALVHCILAFFFNSAVLALTINITAGLM